MEESATAVAKILLGWYVFGPSEALARRRLRVVIIIIGVDLLGNTFWEFKDSLNSNRLRRIVKYNRKVHYADVKISRTKALSPFSELNLRQ